MEQAREGQEQVEVRVVAAAGAVEVKAAIGPERDHRATVFV